MNKATVLFAALAVLSGAALLYVKTIGRNPAEGVAAASVTEPGAGAVSSPAPAAETSLRYVFSAASKIGFTGSKVTGSHSGGFQRISGHFTTDGKQLVGGDHRVIIDMDSTWSDSQRLTGHLKNADFFDVAQFPTSEFVLKTAEPAPGSDSTHVLTGDFTLHGVTKTISFPASVEIEEGRIALQAQFSIKRKDFAIVYPGKPDDLIRDEVVIELDLEATPEPGDPSAAG